MPNGVHQGSRSLIRSASALAACCGSVFLCASDASHAADPIFGGAGAATAVLSAALNDIDPAKVKGAQSCKKCHESEYKAWTLTMHFKNHERISSSAGRQYAQKYGSTDACNSCHTTTHTSSAQFAGPVGVSCESCHTPAGGAEGWFDRHSNYGGEKIKREDETAAHLKERLAACEAVGMIRAEDAYALAKNCYSCHIVADEKLLKAGHKPGHGDFDLIPWIQGEVRHNFQVDQKVNAESPSLLKARYGTTAEQRKRTLLVVGKIVELETCLRSLASVEAGNLKERYAGRRGWAGRAKDAYDFLRKDIGRAIDNEHVQAAIAAVENLPLGRKFKDQAGAKAAADKLAEAAQAFVASSRDADLAGLDKLIEDLDKPKGKSYNP